MAASPVDVGGNLGENGIITCRFLPYLERVAGRMRIKRRRRRRRNRKRRWWWWQ